MIGIVQERRPPVRREEVEVQASACTGSMVKRDSQRAGSETGAPRSVLARERARVARAMLADCRFCAHDCGVNRLAGKTGLCHAGAAAHFFSAQTEVADERELVPAFNVALSGCDLRCDFCITGASSWNPRAGAGFDAHAMAKQAKAALARRRADDPIAGRRTDGSSAVRAGICIVASGNGPAGLENQRARVGAGA